MYKKLIMKFTIKGHTLSFLFILQILFTSCDKFEWHNPYDPECPKQLFTPTALNADMEGNSVKVAWTQSNENISGFALYRSSENESLVKKAETPKNLTQYFDASITPGKKYTYYLIALAGSNKSDTLKIDITPVFAISVTTGLITNLTATSVNVSGRIIDDGGGIIISRGVCWSTTQSPTVNNNKSSEGTGVGEFTSLLTGLQSGTTYYARAYGINSRGVFYGSEITFTPPGLPKVSTAVVSSITINSAKSGGTVINDGGATILSKGVVWGTSTSPTIDLSTKTIDGTGIESFISTLNNLSSNTRYFLRAYATNQIGTAYGSEFTFTTLDNIAINIENGLVAYYPFNGNGNDQTASTNNATPSSVIFSNDYKNNSSSAISIPIGTSGFLKTFGVLQNVENNFSISVWVNPLLDDQIKTQGVSGSENSSSQAVIHASHGANWGDFTQHSGMGLYVAKNQLQIVEHSGGYVGSPLVYNANLAGWHHYVIVYQNKVPSLYVDGVLKKVGLMSIYPAVHPSNGFDSQYLLSGFGRSFAPAGNLGQFNGSFDEIRIYNRALNQSEVTFLANN
jgi:hypothetical protein